MVIHITVKNLVYIAASGIVTVNLLFIFYREDSWRQLNFESVKNKAQDMA